MEKEPKFNLDIITSEQKEKIKDIETLNLGSAQKAELILVLLGVKKSTDVTVYKWNDAPDKVHDTLTRSKFFISENKRERKPIKTFSLLMQPRSLKKRLTD